MAYSVDRHRLLKQGSLAVAFAGLLVTLLFSLLSLVAWAHPGVSLGLTSLASASAAEWGGFFPSGWSTGPSVTCAVSVTDTDGLQATTSQFRYSTNGGTTWFAWQSVWPNISGDLDTTKRMTVTGVFMPDSASQNLAQFQILDGSANTETSPVFTVRVDTSPPTSAISTTGWVPALAAVTGSASDSASGVAAVEIRLRRTSDNQYYNGSGWQVGPVWLAVSGTDSWSYSFTPVTGITYQVESRASDHVGQVQTSYGTGTFTVDGTPPTSSVGSSGYVRASAWTGVITGTASDIGSGVLGVEITIQRASDNYYFDGANWQPSVVWISTGMAGDWSYPFAAASGAWYTVRSRATDLAGNVQAAPAEAGFYVDGSIPTSTVDVSGFLGLSWTNRITGTAQDLDSGVAFVDILIQRTFDNFYYNGAWWQPGPVWLRALGTASWYLDFSATHHFTYVVEARATDMAGNQQASYAMSTFTYDGMRPSSSIATTGLLGRAGYLGSVSGVASDDFTGVQVVWLTIRRETDSQYYDGGSWGSTPTWLPATGASTWSYTFTPTDGVTYTVQSRAIDLAGNQQTPDASGQFMVDGTDPHATVAQSGFYGPATWTSAVTGTASDTVSGVQRVEVNVERLSDHKHWTGSFWIGAPTWVSATGTDTWTLPLTPQDAESYIARARAVDRAGNTQTTPTEAVFTYDARAPLSSITMDEFYRLATWTGVVSGTATDDGSGLARVELLIRRSTDDYYFTGTTWVTMTTWLTATGTRTWTHPVTVTDGITYTVWSRAIDAVGNQQGLYASMSFVYDETRPDSAVSTQGFFRDATWTGAITGTATDVASGVGQVAITLRRSSDGLYWSGALWQAAPKWLTATGTLLWGYPFIPTSGITYTVESKALDRSGNVQATLGRNTFGYDTAQPYSSVQTAGAYGPINWSGGISGTATAGVSGVSAVEITLQRNTDGQFYNGSSWQAVPVWLPATGGSPWSYLFAPGDGATYTVRARAWNGAGTVQATPSTGTFLYDAAPPVAVLGTTRPFRPATWTGVITGTSSDGGTGVQSVRIALQRSTDGRYFDGSGWATNPVWLTPIGLEAWLYSFAPPVEAAYTVQIRATDAVGNVQDPPPSGSFIYDLTAPYAPTDPQYFDGWKNTNVFTVTWENIPDLSGFVGAWYNVRAPTSPTDGTFVQTVNSLSNVAMPGEGVWDLHLWMQDGAGNVNQNRRLVRTGVFRYDGTPPSTSHALSGPLGSNGWYRGPFTVTLSSADQAGLSGLSTTYHRVDGAGWVTATAAFQVTGEGTRQLQYYSTDRAGNVEPTHTVGIGIDSLPPTASHSLAGRLGNNGWYTGLVSVTLAATDATSGVEDLAGYQWRLDGGWWQQGQNWVVTSEGEHTFSYYAIDRAGNTGATLTGTLKIDSVPPSTSLLTDGVIGDNDWFRSAVQLTLEVVDTTSGAEPGGAYYRVDGGAWTKGTAFSLAAQGDHVVEYYGVDRAGNSGAPASQHVKVDSVPPTGPTGITSAPTGWTNVNSFSLAWTPPPDTSGVAGAWFKLNVEPTSNQDGAFVPGTSGIAGISVPGDGVHSIAIWLQDLAGNADYHTRVARLSTFLFDSTPPSSNATPVGTLGENGWYTSQVTVSVTSQDQPGLSGLSAVGYRIGSGGWLTVTGSPTVQIPVPTSGKHVVSYRGVDVAGNAEPVRQLTVRVDREAPGSPRAVQVMPGGWASTDSFVISWNEPVPAEESGVAGAYYKLGSAPAGPTDGTFVAAPFGAITITVTSDGSRDLYLWLKDVAGNVDHNRRVYMPGAIRRDRTAPVTVDALSGTLGGNNWFVTPVGVMLTASDGQGSGVANTQYRLDAGAWITGTAFSVFTDGLHGLGYFSSDNAGNAEPSHAVGFRIDTRPPSSSATVRGTLGSNGWYTSAVTVTVASQDQPGLSGLSALGYRVSAGSWITVSGTSSVDIPIAASGVHTVYYHGADAAGNVETVRQVTVRVDREPPATSRVLTGTLGSANWYISPVQVSLSPVDTGGSGVAGTRYRLDGGSWITGTLLSVTPNGSHMLSYYSIDVAGNPEVSHTVNIRIDSQPPGSTAAPEGALGGSGWYVSPVTVTVTSQDQAGLSGLAAVGYHVDAGGWVTITEASTVRVLITGSGAHMLYYHGRDAAGNVEPVKELPVRIDLEPPVTSHTLAGSLGGFGWYVSPVTVTFAAADGAGSGVASIRYRLDGGAWTQGSAVSVGGGGAHVVEYRSTDVAGNTETIRTVNFRVDRQPPSSRVEVEGTLGSNNWYLSPITVKIFSEDQPGASGVASVAYRVNSTNWITITGASSAEIHLAGSGQSTISFRGRDAAGNLEATRQITTRVDLDAPSTTHRLTGTLGGDNWYTTPVSITLAAADPGGSGVTSTRYRLDGGAWVTGSSLVVSTDGQHTLEYASTDAAGNVEVNHSVAVRLDLRPPSVALVPGRVNPAGNTFGVSWSGTDPLPGSGVARFDVQVQDGLAGVWQDWIVNATLTTANFSGQTGHIYLFRARARDSAGNLGAYPGLGQILVQVPLLVNGGYDEGSFGTAWSQGCEAQFARSVVMTETYGARQSWVAMLGDPSYTGNPFDDSDDHVPVGASCISQTFLVPTASQHPAPALSFWYSILTQDVVIVKAGKLWDSFDVTIQPEGGDPLLVLRDGNYNDLPPLGEVLRLGWRRGLIDLRPYAGQTVTVTFSNWNRNDRYYNTWTLLDDVRLTLMPVNRRLLALGLKDFSGSRPVAPTAGQPPAAPATPAAGVPDRPAR